MRAHTLRGVFVPACTPFQRDLSVDPVQFLRHCRWLLDEGANGLAVFGTTSEANSLGMSERTELLEKLVDGGIDPSVLMPGTGCCALPDSVRLSAHAVKLGCAGVLMLPPFYYKGVSDDGLFAAYAEVIERVADDRLRIYLYHIPPVSQVPISLALIERLLARYPRAVAGIKDSSGNFDNTRAMLERFAPQGFAVFSGSETFLLATLRGGGAGCISATANVNPAAIAALAANFETPDANERQAALDRVRAVFQRFHVIAALKGAVAHASGDEAWATLRPPLVALSPEQRRELASALDAIGFTMPGLPRARATAEASVSSA